MNIVIWGINFHPEPTGIAPFSTDLAMHARRRGTDVEVITGFPYYPHWEKQPDDRFSVYRTDEHAGVRVKRCWLYVPKRASALRRIVHEASFGLTSFVRALFAPRADVYVVVSPPLCLGFFGWIVSQIKGSSFVFHVQDLQPDAAVGMGMMQNGALISALYRLESFIYKRATAVSGISDGMMRAFESKGVPASRRVLFPNWIRRQQTARADEAAATAFRRKLGVDEDDFLAVYSGNIGRKQGIEILVEAALLLDADPSPDARRVQLVIAGAGAGWEDLKTLVEDLKLSNLRLFPLLDDEDYAAMLASANVGLITQASGTGQYFFPSKLLTLLQAGLPLVTVADEDSELAHAVSQGGFALNVPSNQPRQLTDALLRLVAEPELVQQLAANCVWVNRFRPEAVLPRFFDQIEAIAEGRGVDSVPAWTVAEPKTPARI